MSGVKTVGNAMMSAGASPYYESDVAIERHKKLSKRLSKHWKAGLAKKTGGTKFSRAIIILPRVVRMHRCKAWRIRYEDDGDDNSLAYSEDSSIIEPVRNSPSRASDKTSVSFIRNGRVRIVPNSTPVMTRQKVNTKLTMKQEEYDGFIEAENKEKG